MQELVERLGARREEIEQTILTRAYGVSDPAEVGDPAYVEGLKTAVAAAVRYGLCILEGIETSSIPPELSAQARQAARNGISLDTVLRRYFAGYTLLSDFIMREAEDSNLLDAETFRRLIRAQATLFDRLVALIASEYQSEALSRARTFAQRRAECVEGLLAGELIDTAPLAYDLEAWHLGVVAKGAGAEQSIRDIAQALDRRLLALQRGGETIWAWLGGRGKICGSEFGDAAGPHCPPGLSMAVGEPGKGLSGWRLTHRQAAAALPIALRRQSFTRYAEVSLLASILQDDVLARSLNDLYLSPLSQERDGGKTLRETLRAYFEAERNISSAAAALGVSRKTVTSRLRVIEHYFGCPLNECAVEIEVSLRMQELEVMPCAG